MEKGFRDTTVSSGEAGLAKSTIRTWVRGFKKNVPRGSPYLPSKEMKDLLFPGAEEESVVGFQKKKTLPTVHLDIPDQEKVAESLQEMSLNLEQMSAVSSVSDERERDLLSVLDQDEEIEDFDDQASEADIPVKPQKKGKSVVTSGEASATPTSVYSNPGTSSELSHTTPKEDLRAYMEQFMIKMQQNQDRHFALLEQKLAQGTSGPNKDIVSVVDLPKCTSTNPWRFAIRMVMADGMLHIGEGLGTKPLTDLEFYPSL